MGSSPVTATSFTGSPPALERLVDTLRRFFSAAAHPLADGDGLCAGFSGGPDSLALLIGLDRLRAERPFRLVAAHLDHGLDAGSSVRARGAEGLAASRNIPFVVE